MQEAFNLRRGQAYPLPPNRPDLHRVVERIFGGMKRCMASFMHEKRGRQEMGVYMAHVEGLFYGNNPAVQGVVRAASIRKDVQGRPTLFEELIRIGGAWPAKRFR